MNFDRIEAMAVIYFLTRIMEVDSIIDPREVKFMNKMYKELSVAPDDLQLLELMDLNYCMRIISGMEPAKVIYAKKVFEEMAMADGYYHPKERDLIESL